MIPPADVPRLRDYLQIAARGWVVLVCATVLSVGLGWVAWQTVTPVYDSSARVLIKSNGNATPLDALYGQINSETRVLTYQYLARSSRVTGPTIDQLGLPQTTGDLAGRITITPSLTPVLDIVVKGTDPDETRQVANAVTGMRDRHIIRTSMIPRIHLKRFFMWSSLKMTVKNPAYRFDIRGG